MATTPMYAATVRSVTVFFLPTSIMAKVITMIMILMMNVRESVFLTLGFES